MSLPPASRSHAVRRPLQTGAPGADLSMSFPFANTNKRAGPGAVARIADPIRPGRLLAAGAMDGPASV
jgi:hypothetical protein